VREVAIRYNHGPRAIIDAARLRVHIALFTSIPKFRGFIVDGPGCQNGQTTIKLRTAQERPTQRMSQSYTP
jgi:hypothetical protein